MKKLLIAMESDIWCQALTDMLGDSFEIVCCQGGYEALELLREFLPDVTVIDLMLPGLDGLSVLQNAAALGIHTRVVAAGTFFPDYVLKTLEALQVQYVVRLGNGSHHALAARVLDVAQWDAPASQQQRMIRELLTILGIKRNSRYLEVAVELYMIEPDQPMMSWLYPSVAEKCNSSPTGVEKAIRDSIALAWKDRNERIWANYFPEGRSGRNRKPTNSDFIAKIAECIWNQTVPAENKDIREIVAL